MTYYYCMYLLKIVTHCVIHIHAAAVFVHVISLINFVHVTYLLGCTSVYLE